jgi:small subunit ribosomal protein S17
MTEKQIRTKKGTVVSDKMDKTVVVEVKTYKAHPLYKKNYLTTKKFKAHDPENKYKIGDEITIYETRPLSKTKCWTVVAPQTN